MKTSKYTNREDKQEPRPRGRPQRGDHPSFWLDHTLNSRALASIWLLQISLPAPASSRFKAIAGGLCSESFDNIHGDIVWRWSAGSQNCIVARLWHLWRSFGVIVGLRDERRRFNMADAVGPEDLFSASLVSEVSRPRARTTLPTSLPRTR